MLGFMHWFSEGGIYMYLITLLAAFLTGGIIYQFVKAGTVDISPILWGGVAALFIAGIAGTAAGQMQLGEILQNASPVDLRAYIARGWEISMIPAVFGINLAIVGAIATGFASYWTKRKVAEKKNPPQ